MIAKNRKVVVLFAGWTFAIIALLTVYGSLTYDLFFSLAFIGFLALVSLSGPFTVKPAWRSRVGLVIAIGALIFIMVVAWKIYAIGERWSILPATLGWG